MKRQLPQMEIDMILTFDAFWPIIGVHPIQGMVATDLVRRHAGVVQQEHALIASHCVVCVSLVRRVPLYEVGILDG